MYKPYHWRIVPLSTWIIIWLTYWKACQWEDKLPPTDWDLRWTFCFKTYMLQLISCAIKSPPTTRVWLRICKLFFMFSYFCEKMHNGWRLAEPLHRTYLRSFPAPPTACDGMATARTMAKVVYHDSVYGSSPPDCHSLFVHDIRLTLFLPSMRDLCSRSAHTAHYILNVPVGAMRPW